MHAKTITSPLTKIVASSIALALMGIALTACSSNTSEPAATSAADTKEMTLANNPLKGKTLTGTFQPDWGLPLAAMDGDKPVGFFIEIAQAAAAKLGAQIKVVPNDFSTTIPGVQSGKYDIGNGTDATVPRQQVVDVVGITKTGYNFLTYDNLSPAIGDSMDDLCGLTIAQVAGNSVLDVLNAQNIVCQNKGLTTIKILTFPDLATSYLAVKSGRADATNSYAASSGYIAKQDPKWTVSGPTVISGETGFSVKKGTGYAALWAKAVDAIIADGTYGKILDNYGIGLIAIDKSTVNPAK